MNKMTIYLLYQSFKDIVHKILRAHCECEDGNEMSVVCTQVCQHKIGSNTHCVCFNVSVD